MKPAVLVLAAAALVALLPALLAPHAPRAMLAPPVTAPTVAHPLGTNDLGQDLLSLLVFGARASLSIGLATALLSTVLSGAVGAGSALSARAAGPLLAITDGLLAIPHLPLVILLVALVGPGVPHVIATLALLGWPAFARVVRTQTLGVLQSGYVDAARALGATDLRIVRTCVLPQVAPVLWTKFLLTTRWAILMEATLALMGLGDPAVVSWGSILQSAFAYPLLFATSAWVWWALPPALAVAAITLALSALGDRLELRLNPARVLTA